MDIKTQTHARIIKALERMGYKVNWWAPPGNGDLLMQRLYFNVGRKDVKAWIDYADSTTKELFGGHFKIAFRNCGQHRNWYHGQAVQIAKELWRGVMIACWLDDSNDWPLTAKALSEIRKTFREYRQCPPQQRCDLVTFYVN